MPKSSADRAHTAAAASRRKATLVVVLCAAFMDLLDSTIVSIAVPSGRQDPGTGCSTGETDASTRPSVST